jgi:hypothetical protein
MLVVDCGRAGRPWVSFASAGWARS